MSTLVLFVDDKKGIPRALLEKVQLSYGLTGVASDGQDPVERAKALWETDPKPAAAVVDLSISGADQGGNASPEPSWDLIRWLRSKRPDAPIAAWTYPFTDADRQQAQKLGVSIFSRCSDEIDPTMDSFWEQVVRYCTNGGGRSTDGTSLIERQRQLDADYRWALADPQVQRRHGGQVIAVNCEVVWGAGWDHLEALRAARENPGCPDRKRLAFAAIPYLVAGCDTEFAWCLEDEKIQQTYGGMVAAVQGRTIWGAGIDRDAAWQAAQRKRNCPAPDQLEYVFIPYVLQDMTST